jgi:hypothetical protein
MMRVFNNLDIDGESRIAQDNYINTINSRKFREDWWTYWNVQRESDFVADIETSDSEIELYSIQKDGNTRERL